MAPKIPTELPPYFYNGDTLYFIVSNSDFPAGEGWVMSYEFSSGGPSTISSTSDGDTYVFYVTADLNNKDNFPCGDFTWRSYVTKVTTSTDDPPVTTTERFPTGAGSVGVRDSAYQSVAKKKIDAINAYLTNTTTYADYEWTMKSLGDMNVSRGGDPRKNARDDLAYWTQIYEAEIQKERFATGQQSNNMTIWTRFTRN